MACFCFYAHVLYFDFSDKFKLTYYPDADSRGAVAAFFVSLGRQWCCGGDTLGPITQLERRLLAKEVLFYKSINYNNLKNKNDDLIFWRTSWHVFRFCSRRGLSRASNHQQYLRHGSKQKVGCCCHFCCVASQPAAKRMADRAKEESKMKLRIVSKPFDGYMSPAMAGVRKRTSNNCCCCCCGSGGGSED